MIREMKVWGCSDGAVCGCVDVWDNAIFFRWKNEAQTEREQPLGTINGHLWAS
jgi:hypothetical protein